ncbi:MAG: hypothetical protein QOC69_4322 [Mycobacterium sp.]|jgi:hypothetical protein|nr:hypothetical protein [Mycobacterium sp.]
MAYFNIRPISRQGKMNHPMKHLLLQAITTATGAAAVGAPKDPQMPDDAQDHDHWDWAAMLIAAAALGSPRQRDL